MKKSTNIAALKELVNYNVLDRVKLRVNGVQRTAAALKAARRATIAAAAWLRSSHEFFAQDGDPIRCTGWQLVGFNLAAAAVVVLLSIKY